MRATVAIVAVLAGLSAVACDPYYDGGYQTDDPYYEPAPHPPGPPPPSHVNFAPAVRSAEAGVFWDSFRGEDVWYFDAWVEDPDGPLDVRSVWVDVYDDYSGSGYPVQSFELFPGDAPNAWYSEWSAFSTNLDPYYGGYSVEVVAHDSFGAEGMVSVVPYTY